MAVLGAALYGVSYVLVRRSDDGTVSRTINGLNLDGEESADERATRLGTFLDNLVAPANSAYYLNTAKRKLNEARFIQN